MPTTLSIDAVLRILAAGQDYGPTELITALKAEGIEESNAKEAISFLINDHQVEMTENRRLRMLELAA